MKAEDCALNGNILLPSFFCQSSGVSGQGAVLLAPARDLTLALSGPQRGDEEQEREQEGGAAHPRCIHVGPRVRRAAGTPRKRLEKAFGALFRIGSLAGAVTREERDFSGFCGSAPFLSEPYKVNKARSMHCKTLAFKRHHGMSETNQFIENFERFSKLTRLLRRGAEKFKYVFMEDQAYMDLARSEAAAGHGAGAVNRICVQELLFRAHLAAITSVWRNRRWMHGMDAAMKHPNFFSFCANLRGLLESSADSYDALNLTLAAVANNFSMLARALRGQMNDEVIDCGDLENALIHFSHGRKVSKKETAPVSHNAKTSQAYLSCFEENGSPEMRKLYAELCEITHPAAATVEFFLQSESFPAGEVHVAEPNDMDFIGELIMRHDSTFTVLFQKSFNTANLTLWLLNRFDDKRVFTPGAEDINFDKIPSFAEIKEAIAKP